MNHDFFILLRKAGIRLDRVLATRYRDIRSRTYFSNIDRRGQSSFEPRPAKKRIAPKESDCIEVLFPLSKEMDLEPEPIPLQVLYEDEFSHLNK